MKSISVKVRNTLLISLLILIFNLTAVTVGLMYFQSRHLSQLNTESGERLVKYTDSVLDENIRTYAGDLTMACGNVADNNYISIQNRAQAVADYLELLYGSDKDAQADFSYGVGFIEQKNAALTEEFNKIADVRDYIRTMPDYDPQDLSVMDIFVVTQSGMVLDGTYEQYSETYTDLRKDSWYSDGKQAGKLIWTDVIIGSVSGDKKIDCVVPVYYNDEFKGVVVANASLTQIYSTLLDINFKGLKNVLLMDSAGNVIAGDSQYDISGLSEEENIKIFYDEGYCVTSYSIKENDFMAYFVFDIESIIDAMEQTRHYISDNSENLTKHSALYITRCIQIFAVMVVIFAFLAVFASGRLSASLVNPLLRLSELVEGFGKGKRDMDFSPVKTNDEVGLLAGKFEEMTDNIRRYIEEFKQITVQKERFETEMNAARDIQISLMSRNFPTGRGFDVYAYMEAARSVGGDVYAVFKVDENHILAAVADVAGKGIPASLFSVRTKVYMQLYGEMRLTPSEILYRVNNRLCENNDESVFVTAFVCILNTDTGELVYANAGHNKPVVTSENGSAKWLDSPKSLPLGCMEEISYKDTSVMLAEGDGIFIYSDGVTEAVGENDEFYTDARLIARLSGKTVTMSAKAVVDHILNDLLSHYNGREFWDDVTMVSLRYINNKE